jgi:predicted  nucleic acid-binding Zn-ribbon protein
VVKFAEFYEK